MTNMISPWVGRESDHDRLKHKGYFVLFLKLIGIVLLLLLQICLTRIMGEKEYGIFIYVLNWIYVLVLLGKSGLDTAILRFIPQYMAKQKPGYAQGVLARALQITLILSLIASFIMAWMVGLLLGGTESMYLKSVFYLGAILLPLLALLRIILSGIQAYKKVAVAQIPEGIFVPLILIIVVITLGKMYGIGVTAKLVIICMTVLVLCALVFSTLYLFGISSFSPLKNKKQYETKKWVRSAMPLMVVSGMILLLGYLDTIMIGALISPTKSGIYSIASRLAMFATFVLVSLNSAVAPYISEYFADRKYQKIQETLSKVTVASFLFGILFYAAMFFLGKFVLSLFSEPFIEGYAPLLILLAGCMINIASGSVGLIANVTGKQDAAVLFIGFSVLLNVTLNFLLIPKYEMIGAALATSISMAFWNLGLTIYLKHKVGIDTSILSVTKVIK